jgi:threonine synthase
MQIICAHCNTPPSSPLAWRCTCGGPYEYTWEPTFDPAQIRAAVWGQWRYANFLLPPGVPVWARTTLGEGMTPIVTLLWEDEPVSFKLEYLMPTGSYKDRGTSTLLTMLRAQGITEIVEDSSGNAGASIAAYSGAVGVKATIFVPAYTAPAKKAQIAAFGATLAEIEGPRSATSEACHRAAETTLYGSHAWHPAFLLGQVAAAYEIWEQSGGNLPTAIIVPLGQGGMLLGYYRGFRALQRAGLIDILPRLIGVQSDACAPIVAAFEQGLEEPAPVTEQDTIAAGIRIATPARGREMLRALRESNGFALSVSDDAVIAARRALAERGLFVEHTSAVTVAALAEVRRRLPDNATILIPLSGSGLKEGA